MMLERIKAALERAGKNGGVKAADWRIVTIETQRMERYFVRRSIEQTRAVDEVQHTLTVYVDSESPQGKTRGEASVSIQPSLTDAELDDKIARALLAASKSRNPWFDLPGSSGPSVLPKSSAFHDLGMEKGMELSGSALFSPEAADQAAGGAAGTTALSGARINSLELFLSRELRHFHNSKHHDFSVGRWRGYTEFVVDCPAEQGPVELFDDLEFDSPDAERLAEATGSRLAQVADRAKAIPLPQLGDIPVLLVGKEAEDVFGWFFSNAQTSMVFTKASTFAVGKEVQSAEAGAPAEPLDLWAEPIISGLPASSPFDPDGFPLERTQVIEKGVCKNLIGSIRHADWLGLPRKGAFPLFSVGPGSRSLASLRSGPYLEPVMFSDFRLDPVTGDFGAEIRLAYWSDGKKRLPVTGGSISGSVADFKSTMVFSSERGLASRSLCPKAVLIKGLSITAGA